MMLYICMSVAGSIPVIVCFLLWIFQRESYNFRLGKRLLVAGMLFYLTPFQLVKYLMPKDMAVRLGFLADFSVKQNFSESVSIESNIMVGESIWVSRWLYFLSLFWLGVVLVFALYQIIRYRIDIHRLLLNSEEVEVDINGRRQKLLMNPCIYSPYTVGFLKQTIIVPKDSQNHPCFIMCYRHEDQHRRNHDSLMKLLCIVIICMHWMNIFAMLLLFLYNVTAEYICDAYATEEASVKEKKEYIQLLIDLSAKDEPFSMVWRNNLSASDKLIKRRISCMMKRTGMMKKGIAALVTMVTVVASACTILAYEPNFSADIDLVETTENREIEYGFFDDGRAFEDSIVEHNEYAFVYEDGTVEICDGESSDSSGYALCTHSLVDGYYYMHKSNGTGGCTMYRYNAKKCIKCGYVDLGSLVSTTIYVTCPH